MSVTRSSSPAMRSLNPETIASLARKRDSKLTAHLRK